MLTKLRKNSKAAFERYRSEMLTHSKEEVFNKSLRNHFYIAVSDYIGSFGIEQSFGTDDIAKLAELGECVLDVLYDEYLGYEECSVVTWNGIEELLRNYLRGEDENH